MRNHLEDPALAIRPKTVEHIDADKLRMQANKLLNLRLQREAMLSDLREKVDEIEEAALALFEAGETISKTDIGMLLRCTDANVHGIFKRVQVRNGFKATPKKAKKAPAKKAAAKAKPAKPVAKKATKAKPAKPVAKKAPAKKFKQVMETVAAAETAMPVESNGNGSLADFVAT